MEVEVDTTITVVSTCRYWAARMAAEAAAAEQQRQMLAEADAAEAEVLTIRLMRRDIPEHCRGVTSACQLV